MIWSGGNDAILIRFSLNDQDADVPDANTPELRTYVYKEVGDLKIKADVYQYDDDKLRPVVVWIHGGALINGHREGISGPVRKYVKDRGFALVSMGR